MFWRSVGSPASGCCSTWGRGGHRRRHRQASQDKKGCHDEDDERMAHSLQRSVVGAARRFNRSVVRFRHEAGHLPVVGGRDPAEDGSPPILSSS